MAVYVKTKSFSGGRGHDDDPGDGTPYSGFSHEWQSYDGCQVFYKEGEVNGDIGYHTEEFNCDAKPGDMVFVVVAVYSTGGTFGRDEGRSQAAYVSTDPKKARAVADLIEANSSWENKDKKYTVVTQDGESIYCGSWVGYFESLDSVHVETEVVRA